MSAGAVIKYAMTLDGAQYMQELRRSIAETKAAEQAIKSEAQAMGVIKVSSSEMRRALSRGTDETGRFADGLGAAAGATRGFNAMQSALTQAMGGNYVGAAKSASVATRSFMSALSANPAMLAAAGLAAVALSVSKIVSSMEQYRNRMADIRAGHDAFVKSIAEIEGKDPITLAKGALSSQVDNGARGQIEIRKQQDAINGQVAAKKQELIELEAAARTAEERFAAWDSVPGMPKSWNRFAGKPEKANAKVEAAKAEYAALLELQKMAQKAEADNVSGQKQKPRDEEEKRLQARMAKDKAAADAADAENELRRELKKRQVAFAGEKEEDAQKSEIGKLSVRKKNLQNEYMASAKASPGAAGDLERHEILKKIYETEKAIGEEKRKMAAAEEKLAAAVKATEDAKRKALKADWEEYAFSKKSAAEQLSDINKKIAALSAGPRTTETQGQMLDLLKKRDAIQAQMDNGEEVEADSVDGEPTPARRRRIGMGGSRATGRRRMGGSRNSQDWMRQQMKLRRDASGMEYGDTSGKAADGAVEVKGVDKTNTLLASINEKLS